jgi:hypothetical protein
MARRMKVSWSAGDEAMGEPSRRMGKPPHRRPPLPLLPMGRRQALARGGPERVLLPALSTLATAIGLLTTVIGLLAAAITRPPPAAAQTPDVPITPAAEVAPRPPWLELLIGRLAAQPPGHPPQTVWRYRYRGEVVYYLPPQCCDQFSVLFDAKGRVIAAPDGGLSGRGDGRAADFFQQRRQGLLLWTHPAAGPAQEEGGSSKPAARGIPSR